jgi:transposase InsO family protein
MWFTILCCLFVATIFLFAEEIKRFIRTRLRARLGHAEPTRLNPGETLTTGTGPTGGGQSGDEDRLEIGAYSQAAARAVTPSNNAAPTGGRQRPQEGTGTPPGTAPRSEAPPQQGTTPVSPPLERRTPTTAQPLRQEMEDDLSSLLQSTNTRPVSPTPAHTPQVLPTQSTTPSVVPTQAFTPQVLPTQPYAPPVASTQGTHKVAETEYIGTPISRLEPSSRVVYRDEDAVGYATPAGIKIRDFDDPNKRFDKNGDRPVLTATYSALFKKTWPTIEWMHAVVQNYLYCRRVTGFREDAHVDLLMRSRLDSTLCTQLLSYLGHAMPRTFREFLANLASVLHLGELELCLYFQGVTLQGTGVHHFTQYWETWNKATTVFPKVMNTEGCAGLFVRGIGACHPHCTLASVEYKQLHPTERTWKRIAQGLMQELQHNAIFVGDRQTAVAAAAVTSHQPRETHHPAASKPQSPKADPKPTSASAARQPAAKPFKRTPCKCGGDHRYADCPIAVEAWKRTQDQAGRTARGTVATVTEEIEEPATETASDSQSPPVQATAPASGTTPGRSEADASVSTIAQRIAPTIETQLPPTRAALVGGALLIDLKIAGHGCTALLDTGSQISLLGLSSLQQIAPGAEIVPVGQDNLVRLHTADGTELHTLGVVRLLLDQFAETYLFFVVPDGDDGKSVRPRIILGCNVLDQHTAGEGLQVLPESVRLGRNIQLHRSIATPASPLTVSVVALSPSESPHHTEPPHSVGAREGWTVGYATQPSDQRDADPKPDANNDPTALALIKALTKLAQTARPESDRKRIQEILLEHMGVFCFNLEHGGQAKVAPHMIQLKPDARPPKRPHSHSVPLHLQEVWRKTIEEMERQGVIYETESDWVSRAFFVRQGDKYRMVINFVPLNLHTVQTYATLPLLKELIQSLGHYRHFSKFDLKMAYHQIPLDPRCRHLTAFLTPDGRLMAFTVIPLGITNAPATFQGVMRQVLKGLIGKSCTVFLDDILVHSVTADQHLKDVEEVLRRLAAANLKISVSKSAVGVNEFSYLGHVISVRSDGAGLEIRPKEEAAYALIKMPAPVNIKQLRSFLGLANYFGDFIKGLAATAEPLYTLLRKNVHWSWTSAHETAFQEIKRALAAEPILRPPDITRPFHLRPDASDYAVGAALLQVDGNGVPYAVQFGSRLLNGAQRNYSATGRECLAVIHFLDKWRFIIGDQKVYILSDHSALTPILNAQNSRNPRLHRWAVTLAEFNYEVAHVKGSENSIADAFSRLPIPESAEEPSEGRSVESVLACPITALVGGMGSFLDRTEHLRQEQLQDPQLKEYFDFLEGRLEPATLNERRRLLAKTVNLEIVDGVVHHVRYGRPSSPDADSKFLPVIPASLRDQVLQAAHGNISSGHFGRQRTYFALAERCWWARMWEDVVRYVRSCATCQAFKAPQKRPGELMTEVARYVLESIAIDHVGPLPETASGMKHFVTIVDRLSRFAYARAVPDTSAENAADALMEFCFLYSFPSRIHSDRGSAFTSELFQAVLDRLAIAGTTTTAYHPAGNGLCERVNGIVQDQLKRMLDGRPANQWDDFLLPSVHAYNTMFQSVLKTSPHFVFFGRPPNLPLDAWLLDVKEDNDQEFLARLINTTRFVAEQVRESNESQFASSKFRYDKRHEKPNFRVGELVMLRMPDAQRTSKLDRIYKGPYQVVVVRSSNRNVVTIQHFNNQADEQTVNVDRLKRYYSRSGSLEDQTDEDVFEIDRIVDDYIADGKQMYVVRWAGYTQKDDSPLPAEAVPKAVLQQYQPVSKKKEVELPAPQASDAPPHPPAPMAEESTPKSTTTNKPAARTSSRQHKSNTNPDYVYSITQSSLLPVRSDSDDPLRPGGEGMSWSDFTPLNAALRTRL